MPNSAPQRNEGCARTRSITAPPLCPCPCGGRRPRSAKSHLAYLCIRDATRFSAATWPMRALSWEVDGMAVIDTLGSAVARREVRDAIRAVTNKPIRYVINTHMHPDHVFGNAAFKEDDPVYVGHHKLARALASRAERYLAINKQMLGDEAFEGIEIRPCQSQRRKDGLLRQHVDQGQDLLL